MKKNIAILGGGNGAHTMAGDLALRGYGVRMWEDPAFIGRLSVLRDTLTIRCTGEVSGNGKIEMLTERPLSRRLRRAGVPQGVGRRVPRYRRDQQPALRHPS